jgi:hypothetical protein
MSKGKLEFDLNDFDDKMEFERCIKSTDMAIVIFDVIYNYRKSLTYDIENSIEKGVEVTSYDVLTMFLEKFSEDLTERGINIDNLIR